MFVRIPAADFGSRFDWHILHFHMAATEKKQDGFYTSYRKLSCCSSYALYVIAGLTWKWVQCLSMFLGQHYLFLHWGSCSQIPQNKHIWEYWACILRTRDWRCTSASKRKSQAVFLGKQEKRACNRFLIFDCDCAPSFTITETPALSLADSHYLLHLSPVIILTF